MLTSSGESIEPLVSEEFSDYIGIRADVTGDPDSGSARRGKALMSNRRAARLTSVAARGGARNRVRMDSVAAFPPVQGSPADESATSDLDTSATSDEMNRRSSGSNCDSSDPAKRLQHQFRQISPTTSYSTNLQGSTGGLPVPVIPPGDLSDPQTKHEDRAEIQDDDDDPWGSDD